MSDKEESIYDRIRREAKERQEEKQGRERKRQEALEKLKDKGSTNGGIYVV